MEPQLEGCGKSSASGYGGLPDDKLQWSRNLRVAESGFTSGVAHEGPMLQWSRNLRVAERSATQAPENRKSCFNGAAT